jgi:ParB family chromosome partitioning protein
MDTPTKEQQTGKMDHMSNAEQTMFEQGALEHLDPRTLEVDGNVRDDPALTKQFIASIAENGVLVPITAVRTQDGTVRVRTGQRRTLAAREAGLATIPVYVIGAGWEDVAQRSIEQIVENDHREKLTEVQRVFGIQQILDAGVSVTKTAKKLSVPQAKVKAAKTVAGSQAAVDALSDGQLTLDQAAALAEFEDDERSLERLLRCAGSPYNFDHTLSLLREERDSAAKLAVAEKQWREQGYTVLDGPPASFDPDYVGWDFLLKDGQPVTDDVITDPRHWAVTLWEEAVLTNTETGAEVYEDDVDWETQDKPDATPAKGKLHADKVEEVEQFVPEFYYCIDLAGAGLTVNERFAKLSGMGADKSPSELTDDQIAARVANAEDMTSAQRVAEAAEAEKRERRKVLALNRLGDAAQNVRRQFVTALLARKTPPKGAAIFVARCLARDPHLLANYKADEVAVELLGAPEREHSYSLAGDGVKGGVEQLVAALPENGDGRAQVITLGLILGALENRTPKDAWRGAASSHFLNAVDYRWYLEFLAANGYELADIELVMTGKRKADKVYDAYLAGK